MDISEKTFENLISIEKLVRKGDIEPPSRSDNSEGYVLYSYDEKSPEEILIEKEEQEKIKNYLESYLSKLPPRDAEIVKMRLGYEYEQMTLEEIGKTLPTISNGKYEELTRERVRQILLKYSWLVDKRAS
jgi:DNA-directed RNA polymerase sigma subunit (sigma70/sigma32)